MRRFNKVILTEREVLLFLQSYINRRLEGSIVEYDGEDYLLSRSVELISKLLNEDERGEDHEERSIKERSKK